MKATQLRALIGKKVEWEYAHDRHRGTYLIRQAVITDVKGKNVAVDSGGMSDWVHADRLINLREAKPNAKVSGPEAASSPEGRARLPGSASCAEVEKT